MLRTLTLGAGAHALGAGRLPDAIAKTTDVTAQIRSDLERHASFGDKCSGGPGDIATADWIAGRLRGYGYRVRELEFDAPFFVKRAARLATGSAMSDVLPGAPVVPTVAAGVTAPLALVESSATPAIAADPRGKIALVIAPFRRHVSLSAAGIGKTVQDPRVHHIESGVVSALRTRTRSQVFFLSI